MRVSRRNFIIGVAGTAIAGGAAYSPIFRMSQARRHLKNLNIKDPEYSPPTDLKEYRRQVTEPLTKPEGGYPSTRER